VIEQGLCSVKLTIRTNSLGQRFSYSIAIAQTHAGPIECFTWTTELVGNMTGNQNRRLYTLCNCVFSLTCTQRVIDKGGLTIVPIVPWPLWRGPPVWMHFGISAGVRYYTIRLL